MSKIFLTCAVTGNHTTRQQHPDLPVTPNEIAEACLGAAEAGAAAVHIHVRDPETGRPSMELQHYADVVAQIRQHNKALVINLTTGPGGRFQPSEHDPVVPGPRTNLLVPEKRVQHIAELKPDIATLDLNTMVFGGEVVINTPANIRRMAKVMREAGVRPELELFDSGDIVLMHDLIADGTLDAPPLCSLVMGIKYGFAPTIEMMLVARSLLPPGSHWTGFGTGRHAFPLLAQAVLAGGNVRIGLEDAVFLSKGVLAPSNAAMVEKARRIVEDLGSELATPDEMRAQIGLAR
ncbi:3-keto-5-aminohexanoate cleavage protein [Terricaulis sp.]|uniref:3-keto-5-aminohexanoate cleavage protein n=1 Tax=Terricaulis sp. TaxID=2768686 RepID=UPI003783F86A